MANQIEIAIGTTVFVYCTTHRLLRELAVPSLALSCYVHSEAGLGRIGFDCSNEALEARAQIVEGGTEYDGSVLKCIGKDQEVIFSPQSPKWNLWKIISQHSGKLCSDKASDQLPAGFKERLLAIGSAFETRRRDPQVFADFVALHLDFELEMQLWPFMTPYESVCYLFGSDTASLVSQVECFFDKMKASYYRIDDRRFPID